MSEPLTSEELRRLLDVGRSLVAELDLEAVLQQVLETARDLTAARYAALGILDESREELERFLYIGLGEEDRRRIGHLPRGRGVLGELIRNPAPLRLADVKAHPRSFGFPAGHPPMTSFLGVPILIRGEAFGNLYLTEKEGAREFARRDEELVTVLAEWAAVAIENARLYEGAERRRAELERAVKGLEATVSLNRQVGGETDLDWVLELIAKRGRDLVEARALACLLPRGGDLVVAEAAGELPEALRDAALPLDEELAGEVLRSGRPLRLAAGEPGPALLGLEPPAILVPLMLRGRGAGVLVAAGRLDGSEFSADDELLLSSFATSAATAIATAQDLENARLRHAIAASEQERRRWARELHDETLQELGALRLMHESALRRGEPEAMRDSLERASGQLERTIATLEALISELRPVALDQLGIEAALEALIERTRAARGLAVESSIALGQREGRLAPELEATIYRVVQEALNNVLKHAGASRVRISVGEREGEVSVTVEDDGRGFEAGSETGRFGLVGMRERVELAGGELSVESRPGRGTRVAARLPLARPSAAERR